MGAVHKAIEEAGKQATLLIDDFGRNEVEAAAAYLSDEEQGVGYLFSGWCQAALPHRRLPDSKGWQVSGERVTLVVEPGMRPGPGGEPVHVGVPFGSRARLILLYLQSEALKSGSREVELGAHLTQWMKRLGVPIGGRSADQVREQAERLAMCKLSFHVRTGAAAGMMQQTIVDTAFFVDMDEEGAPGQGSLFAEKARLSEGFFEQLRRHPVPLEEAAIRALNNNSMALDLYAWAAYRLHSLKSPTPVSWRALKPQFGVAFNRLDNFRARFLDNLKLAMAVYPDARIDVTDTGLLLHPSKPPVAPRIK
ncbi:replication protein RepA [Roseomonas chloroacetimidivorans]|uniref:replication protein RepA n=1 Tax=Roseomonas chloroacetimidivorans TaxID=1766656 RepID=UPI003C72223B